MALATRFVQPTNYYGTYRTNSWAGYVFKEALGYTTGRHTGTDYNGPGGGDADLGLEVRAVANGVVRAIRNRTDIGFGLTVIIEHPLGAVLRSKLSCEALFSRSMHLQEAHVTVGQTVKIGQGIGKMGNSGTKWAHLHLDLYKNTIGGGGVHWRYDKDTQLMSYLDPYEFIQNTLAETEPASVLQPYQRVVGSVGVNHRDAPNTSAKIRQEWSAGEILDFKGYVKGETVSGNNVWFVGKYSGGYLWSGSFTDSTTRGLSDLTPVDPVTIVHPDTPPIIERPAPAMFVPDSPLVTKVIPSPNFIAEEQEPTFILVHQWGRPDDEFTLQGVLNGFLEADGLGPHYVVNDYETIQMIPEKYRAQHGGPEGNDGIGIEYDPNGGDAMYARARGLNADIRHRRGNLPIEGHNKYVITECPEYIDLARLEPETVEPTTPAPTTPDPLPEPAPEQPDEVDYAKENNSILKRIEAAVNALIEFLKARFK